MLTYHKDIALPKVYARPVTGSELIYSRHAQDQSYVKGFYRLLPHTLPSVEVIEVTLDKGMIIKWVVRFALTPDVDLVLVLLPDGFVKTVWTNDRADKHRTLNHSAYARSE